MIWLSRPRLALTAVAAIVAAAVAWRAIDLPQDSLPGTPTEASHDNPLQVTQATLAIDDTVLEVLTFEGRKLATEKKGDQAEKQPAGAKQTETTSIRQAAVRARTQLIRPSPDIRHATARYHAFFPQQSPDDQKLLASLDQEVTDFHLAAAPLQDVCTRLKERFKLPFELDVRGLEDLGLDAQTPVASTFSGGTLRGALRSMLEPLDLAHVAKDGVVLITTIERANDLSIVGFYPLPTSISAVELIDLIESTVGTAFEYPYNFFIAPLLSANELLIATDQATHDHVGVLMAKQDADLTASHRAPGSQALRVYAIQAPHVLVELETKLIGLCNNALGPTADPTARVFRLGNKLVVQSSSRPFQIYAAEVIRSINGLKVITAESVDAGIQHRRHLLGEDLNIAIGGGPFGYRDRRLHPGGFAPQRVGALAAKRRELISPDLSSALFYSEAYVYENTSEESEVTPLKLLTAERLASVKPALDGQFRAVDEQQLFRKAQIAVRERKHVVHPQPRHQPCGNVPFHGSIRLTYSDRDIAVLAALDNIVDSWSLERAPLRQVQQAVHERTSLPCAIDIRSLEQAGLSEETVVTGHYSGMRLGDALRKTLGACDLGFLIKDGSVLITTQAAIERNPIPAVYPLPTGVSPREVAELITMSVAAETWASAGGFGSIRVLRTANQLAISTTEAIHLEVASYLRRWGNGIDDSLEHGAARSNCSVQRYYHIRSPQALAGLESQLVPLCNTALGASGDTAATVSTVGDCLIVHSGNHSFQSYAAQMISAIDGIETTSVELFDFDPFEF